MARTPEQIIREMLSQKDVAIAHLQSQVEQLQERVKALEVPPPSGSVDA